MRNDEPPGLADRFADGVDIERTQAAQVQYFDRHALVRPAFAGGECIVHATPDASECHISSGALDVCPPERDDVFAFGNVPLGAIERDLLWL